MTVNLFELPHRRIRMWNIELFDQDTPRNNIEGIVKYERENVKIDNLKKLFNSEEIDSIFRHMFNLLADAVFYFDKRIYKLRI
ncbi:MAG TPA: hypothetical protein DCP90_08495 [Clostridiales bacterium]|nr:MAG: hypothetical protein A2Y22_05930 [Clostridiales bacterium GWD2_32_59]HAN10632.1 hypothetical protein [Clostridiales bacterium]